MPSTTYAWGVRANDNTHCVTSLETRRQRARPFRPIYFTLRRRRRHISNYKRHRSRRVAATFACVLFHISCCVQPWYRGVVDCIWWRLRNVRVLTFDWSICVVDVIGNVCLYSYWVLCTFLFIQNGIFPTKYKGSHDVAVKFDYTLMFWTKK